MRFLSFRIVFATLVIALLATYLIKRAYLVPSEQVGSRQLLFPDKEKLIFFALGDTGTGKDEQKMVAQAMEKRCQQLGQLDGILLLGDNIYHRGVDSADDKQWQEKVEAPYSHSPCLAQTPLYPVLGNHDYKGKPGAQITYSEKNPQWHLPARFYKLQYGSLLKIVAIDSAFPDFCFLPEFCSLDFLLHEIPAREFRWLLVTAHHPLSTTSALSLAHKGGLMGPLLRPLVCKQVDAWLSGHAHHLEHRQLADCPASLWVSGGGGAKLYAVTPDPQSPFALSSYGFLEIQIDRESMQFTFLNHQGQSLYRFSQSPSSSRSL